MSKVKRTDTMEVDSTLARVMRQQEIDRLIKAKRKFIEDSEALLRQMHEGL